MTGGRALLLILDGAGYAPPGPGNAVTPETMPFLFGLARRYGVARLQASGPPVGLAEGQAGNSEVGHVTLGAGAQVPSTLQAIERAYGNGSWRESPVWDGISAGGELHLLGLLSDAGVHGFWPNLVRSAELALARGIPRVHVHPILDGVDSPAGSATRLLAELIAALLPLPGVTCDTVIGRQWACDRSGNLAITRVLTDRLAGAELPVFSWEALTEHLREHGREAGFPGHRFPGGRPLAQGSPVLLTNHRADRTRQVAQVLAERHPVFSLVEMDDAVPGERVFFPRRPLERGLAFELARHGIRSLRIAEQCKFPHVTYFFNGFHENLGEETECLPSVAEASIGDHPEMSAAAVAAAITAALRQPGQRALVANLANLDQVGHLGRVELTVQAARLVDSLLADLHRECERSGFSLMITSDHGNADTMLDPAGRPFGSHSLEPVPLVLAPAPGWKLPLARTTGSLANVAATYLTALGLTPPEWMEASLTGS